MKDRYSYFKNFAIQNGTLNGDYATFARDADAYGGSYYDTFSLTYWGDTDTVEFCLHRVLDETYSINFYLSVPKDASTTFTYIVSYYYRSDGYPVYEARGSIDAAQFTKSYPLTSSSYYGDTDVQNDFMEISRQGICELISLIRNFLSAEELAYRIGDLGFAHF